MDSNPQYLPIELCDRNAEAVIALERNRGFEIFDRRDWSKSWIGIAG